MQDDAGKRLGQCVVNFPRQTVPFLGHRQLLGSTSQPVELQGQSRTIDQSLGQLKVIGAKLGLRLKMQFEESQILLSKNQRHDHESFDSLPPERFDMSPTERRILRGKLEDLRCSGSILVWPNTQQLFQRARIFAADCTDEIF